MSEVTSSPVENDREIYRRRLAGQIIDFTYEAATSEDRPDTLIFLDKSARPLSWGFRAAWPHIAPDVKRPEIKFANIGREKNPIPFTGKLIGPYFARDYATESQPLRTHLSFQNGSFNNDRCPAILADSNVWIVDDIRSTGVTMDFALATFRKTFPEADFTGKTVLRGQCAWYGRPDLIGVEDFDKTSFRTRGVEDKDLSKNLRREISEIVLANLAILNQ